MHALTYLDWNPAFESLENDFISHCEHCAAISLIPIDPLSLNQSKWSNFRDYEYNDTNIIVHTWQKKAR